VANERRIRTTGIRIIIDDCKGDRSGPSLAEGQPAGETGNVVRTASLSGGRRDLRPGWEVQLLPISVSRFAR
jgi:hypothetical protein